MTTMTSPEERLGSLWVEERVFQGSGSEILRCRDPLVERHVAVKRARIDSENPELDAQGLWREAHLRGRLDHASLLPLYGAHQADSGDYLIGPWLEGGSLGERFRHECLPRALLLQVVTAMTSALDTLHGAGFVHGDLHWGNILLAATGRPVLIDFVSARPMQTRWCEAGKPARLQVMPHIVAPEVWRGEPVDGRADFYSLGAIIFRGLVGMYPFDADDLRRIPSLHCEAPIPSFADSTPGLGTEMEMVVRRCLAKHPDARYATGAELAGAFHAAFEADGGNVPQPQERPSLFQMPAQTVSSWLQGMPEEESGFDAGMPSETPSGQNVKQPDAAKKRGRMLQELGSLTTQVFGVPAAMLALEDIGATPAMAAGAETPGDIAAACGAPENAVLRLLETLWKAGFIGERDGRYFLPPPLAAGYASSSGSHAPKRPVRQSAAFWGHLSQWALTYEPFHRMDQQDGGRYSAVVGVLGRLFTQRAERLAGILRETGEIPQGPRILDVGAGSAIWSLTLAGHDAQATVTAVDRPKVLRVTRTAAEAAGLAQRFHGLAGDWRDVALPEDGFDVAFLANLCHLESGPDVAELFGKLAGAIREGGLLVLVDTIPDDRNTASLSDFLYGLRMGLRTSKGDLHSLEAYRAWLRQAGLEYVTSRRLDATGPGLSAVVARRPVVEEVN